MCTQVFTRDGTIELEASVSEALPEHFGLLSRKYIDVSAACEFGP